MIMKRRDFLKSSAAEGALALINGTAPTWTMKDNNGELWDKQRLIMHFGPWKDFKYGYAMWCFRGSFGIADSGRKDVQYENYNGIKLDRKMVELLKTV
jgi:hypothetical protein